MELLELSGALLRVLGLLLQFWPVILDLGHVRRLVRRFCLPRLFRQTSKQQNGYWCKCKLAKKTAKYSRGLT